MTCHFLYPGWFVPTQNKFVLFGVSGFFGSSSRREVL